ncbi:uncharacterized protein LOC130717648 [Lotus japonicus]|uniref:uncharacterized protein LOC130717648 n=1 Tax=Lotus japonicus TaxID=34305 RepID=UPI00258B342F|nr:uncharacterized protein LOC130717648 [Lotus japonicus]XP_057423951.1 uncharacterized protein LOC130717648 [Lotus japonicus]XP_057423952.1 uncharacterized protein LOC130717648 [Lotus japonicus]XP_057423953.1 uncharacterized protein LOC130717648 [Lotus japonicus]
MLSGHWSIFDSFVASVAEPWLAAHGELSRRCFSTQCHLRHWLPSRWPKEGQNVVSLCHLRCCFHLGFVRWKSTTVEDAAVFFFHPHVILTFRQSCLSQNIYRTDMRLESPSKLSNSGKKQVSILSKEMIKSR